MEPLESLRLLASDFDPTASGAAADLDLDLWASSSDDERCGGSPHGARGRSTTSSARDPIPSSIKKNLSHSLSGPAAAAGGSGRTAEGQSTRRQSQPPPQLPPATPGPPSHGHADDSCSFSRDDGSPAVPAPAALSLVSPSRNRQLRRPSSPASPAARPFQTQSASAAALDLCVSGTAAATPYGRGSRLPPSPPSPQPPPGTSGAAAPVDPHSKEQVRPHLSRSSTALRGAALGARRPATAAVAAPATTPGKRSVTWRQRTAAAAVTPAGPPRGRLAAAFANLAVSHGPVPDEAAAASTAAVADQLGASTAAEAAAKPTALPSAARPKSAPAARRTSRFPPPNPPDSQSKASSSATARRAGGGSKGAPKEPPAVASPHVLMLQQVDSWRVFPSEPAASPPPSGGLPGGSREERANRRGFPAQAASSSSPPPRRPIKAHPVSQQQQQLNAARAPGLMLPTPAPPAADSTQTSGAASASAVGGSSGLRAHKRQLQQWAAQHLSAAEALLQRQLEARAAALAAERAAAAARCRAHREKLQEALARLEGLLAATAAEEAQVEIQYARGMTGLKQEYARVLAGQRRQLELAAREALRGAVLHDMAAVAAVAAPPVEPLAVVTAGSGGGNTSGAIVASASAAGKVR